MYVILNIQKNYLPSLMNIKIRNTLAEITGALIAITFFRIYSEYF